MRTKKETGVEQIRLTVHEESELYNPFDEELLSDDVVSFLEIRTKGTSGNISLCICSDCQLDEERARRAFARLFSDYEAWLDVERKRNTARQFILFGIGVFFIGLWLFVSAVTEGIWPEVLSIIGSFAVWEAANIWILDNPTISVEKYWTRKLEKAEISFRYSAQAADDH